MTMRNIARFVLPMIVAAGTSTVIFTAALI
jgi:hypothetical protein